MQNVLNEDLDIFKAIKDTLSGIQKISKDKKNISNKAKFLNGSIARYSKSLTMSFPVLADNTLSFDTIQMISKANEKNITTMLSMLFASMSLNYHNNEINSGADIIKLFHKNIDSMPIDDYMDAVDTYIAQHEASYTPSLSKVAIREAVQDMVLYLKQPKKVFPVDSFNEKSLNEYMSRNDYRGNTVVYEAPRYKDLDTSNIPIAPGSQHDVGDLNSNKFIYQQAKDQRDFEYKTDKDQRDHDYQKQQDDKNYNYRQQQDDKNYNYRQQQDNIQNRRAEQNRRDQFAIDTLNLNKQRILDGDIKKANELQPTTMIINFNITEGDDEHAVVVDRKSFVAGVKCRIIATSAIDIAERLLSTNKTQTNFKNFIRATSGEISFTKDFIVALDQQKLTAKNDVKKGEAAKLWSTLKKRSTKNSYNKLKKASNDASAITTLVLSQDTVNYISSNKDKFDISEPKNARMVMEEYNLLCLVIADETNEVAKFLYDGNNDFEYLSYNALSKDTTNREYMKAVNYVMSGR